MFEKLIRLITGAISGTSFSSNSRSGRNGPSATGKSQMARKVGDEVLNQVRKAGPDAAQRHLGRTKLATDPRAQKAARAADDLARKFAGTGGPTANRPDSAASAVDSSPSTPPQADGARKNQWGDRP